MDWFHCNKCFTKRGSKFSLSSCGHICCDACIKSKECSICGANCSYLAITDKMKPQEKVFFKDPVKLIQSRLAHLSQIASFQQKQMERIIAHFRNKASELEQRLKKVTEQSYRQISELKTENAELKKQLTDLKREAVELKKPLSQRRRSVCPAQFQTNGTQRVSLPVAVASPVTPLSRTISHAGSAESQRWIRGPSRSITTTGSMASISSHSSLHAHRTSPSFSTPARTQTPVFQFPFMNAVSIQSPRQ